MPTSDYHQISDVLHVVEQADPRSILDIGVGFGKWGILCREILEVYHERLHRNTWVRIIDGIEIFEPYKNPLWELAYDNVYIGDAFEILDGLGKYDVILCCDVIEHFDKQVGMAFLDKLLKHGDLVVITSPRGHFPQGAIYGNEWEAHKSVWTAKDFSGIPYLYKDIGATFMVVLSAHGERLRSINIRQHLDVLGVKRGFLELLRMVIKRGKHRIIFVLSRLSHSFGLVRSGR